MKRILEFAEQHPKPVAIGLGAILLASLLWIFVPMIGSSINEHRITKLESEKQELLKQVDQAHDRDLILQGQIKAKDEQIQNLTAQIEDSNQRVSNAHKETVSARSNYDKVRADGPHFNATDDAGRVVELGTDLRGLYPDTP